MSLNEEEFINVLNDIEKSRYNKSLNEINYRDVRQEEYTLAIETIDRENQEFVHNYEAILKGFSDRQEEYEMAIESFDKENLQTDLLYDQVLREFSE